MTIKHFDPNAKRTNTPPQQSDASSGSKQRGVSIFHNGQFGMTAMGNKLSLQLTPAVVKQFKTNGPRGVHEDDRGRLIYQLDLPDYVIDDLDRTAEENDITFREAVAFRLAMSTGA